MPLGETLLMVKKCTKCREIEAINGSWCRKCRAETEVKRRLSKGIKSKRKRNPDHLKQGLKECFKCDKLRPLDHFSTCKRGYAGRNAWCKPCCSAHACNNRRIITAYALNYRKGNERYRVQHCSQSQKRRAIVSQAADGTVDTEFMLSLYAGTHCYYCKKCIEQDKRTADHKIPLSKGGLHSRVNLVMACSECNSRKKDKTDLEFFECMKQK